MTRIALTSFRFLLVLAPLAACADEDTGPSEEQLQARRRVLLLETAIVELGNYRSETELIAALETAP